MQKIKLFFDKLDYIVYRLFLIGMAILGVVVLLVHHWPWHR